LQHRGVAEVRLGVLIDNLLKPMLDAFCGPNGLLVDDCQVRSLGISWISTTSDQPAVTIQVHFIDSDFVPKAGIVGSGCCVKGGNYVGPLLAPLQPRWVWTKG
jgi:hypothetical protein